MQQDSTRLAIGTAQFGLTYGIANRNGQVSESEGRAILGRARQAGVDTIDTAIGYGTAEEVLGRIGVRDLRVITKLPQVPDDVADVRGWIERTVEASLRRLRLDRIAGLLLHRPSQLLGSLGPQILESILDMKKKGLVEKSGFSVYAPEELDQLWELGRPDLVQVPFNVLDRRILTSGWMKRMTDAGTEVHCRSVFLQGLLLMDSQARPAGFERWQDLWTQWDEWLEANDATPLRECLAHVFSQPGISRVVIGVDSSMQFEEILESMSEPAKGVPAELLSEDSELLNPSLWPTLKG